MSSEDVPVVAVVSVVSPTTQRTQMLRLGPGLGGGGLQGPPQSPHSYLSLSSVAITEQHRLGGD